MAHLRAVPDPDDDPVDAPPADGPADGPADPAPGVDDARESDEVTLDPAAAVAAGEDEVSAADQPDSSPDDGEPRRYPSTIGGAFYLSILAAAATALVVAARSDWRLGIEILGGAMIVGALLRLVLANRDAGMLAVRNRLVDVLLLGATGAALIALAASIPDMPTR